MVIPRIRAALLSAASVAAVVFCGYGIPAYYHLLAHQPGRDPQPTSFPPSYAFFLGGYFAALSFLGVCIIFLLVHFMLWLFRRDPTA
jgi:hypothetical protein